MFGLGGQGAGVSYTAFGAAESVVKYVNAPREREPGPEFAREKIEVQATQTNQYGISDSSLILCPTVSSVTVRTDRSRCCSCKSSLG